MAGIAEDIRGTVALCFDGLLPVVELSIQFNLVSDLDEFTQFFHCAIPCQLALGLCPSLFW